MFSLVMQNEDGSFDFIQDFIKISHFISWVYNGENRPLGATLVGVAVPEYEQISNFTNWAEFRTWLEKNLHYYGNKTQQVILIWADTDICEYLEPAFNNKEQALQWIEDKLPNDLAFLVPRDNRTP